MKIPNLNDEDVIEVGMLPPGEYPALITNATETTSKVKGTPGINVELVVADDAAECAGRHFWDTLWISDTPGGLGYLKGKLKAVGVEIPDGEFDLAPESLRGRRIVAVITHRVYEGMPQMNVAKWKPIVDGAQQSMAAELVAATGATYEDDTPF